MPAGQVEGNAPTVATARPSVRGGLPDEGPPEQQRYHLGKVIACGGLGRIYLAQDLKLKRAVAVKELLERDAESDARFQREAYLTARLEHPGIVPVHDSGSLPGGGPFYAMKWIEGRSLADLLEEKGGMEQRLELLSNLIAVCEAIAYAHSRHIIHRDLKPENVVVGAFGETVVIDWGLAKDLTGLAPGGDVEDVLSGRFRAYYGGVTADQATAGPLTQAGAVMGTPTFM